MKVVLFSILFCGFTTISFARTAIDLQAPEYRDEFEDLLNSPMLKTGEKITITVNTLIDKLLKELEKNFQSEGVDPLPLADVEEKIRKKIGFIHYKGSVKLTSIIVKGLSSLYRSGDSVVSYDTKTKKARLDIPLKLNKLDVSCDFRAKLPPIKTHGRITGEMKDVQMVMSIGIDFNTRKAFSLQYKITHSGSIKLHFHVNKLVNWLMNLIGNAATKMFKSKIIHKLDNVINKLIQKVVDEINNIISGIVSLEELAGHLYEAPVASDTHLDKRSRVHNLVMFYVYLVILLCFMSESLGLNGDTSLMIWRDTQNYSEKRTVNQHDWMCLNIKEYL